MSECFSIKDSHPFLISSKDVDNIIRPLKDHLHITSLVYQKNLNDGSEIRLSNQPEWVKHFYAQGYFSMSGFEKHPQLFQSGLVVWSHLSHHSPILNAAHAFNIDHGITLINKQTDGCEFYFIGTTPNRPFATNLWLNHLDTLQQFTLYFKDKADLLLKNATRHRLTIPKKFDLVSTHEQGIPYIDSLPTNVKNLLNVKKIHINSSTTLTQRELACAKLLLQGQSARLIATTLFISQRTVETHLQNLKDKFNCRTKYELIQQLKGSNITF